MSLSTLNAWKYHIWDQGRFIGTIAFSKLWTSYFNVVQLTPLTVCTLLFKCYHMMVDAASQSMTSALCEVCRRRARFKIGLHMEPRDRVGLVGLKRYHFATALVL